MGSRYRGICTRLTGPSAALLCALLAGHWQLLAQAEPPSVNGPLLEGETKISGAAKGASRVRLKIYLRRVELTSEKKLDVEVKQDKFVAALDFPLVRSMKVVVVRLEGEAEKEKSEEYEVSAPQGEYDWGRVRADFSVGAILSQHRGAKKSQFSKVDPYAGLDMGANWANWKWQCWRIKLNTYFTARLTSIPVATQPTDLAKFASSEKAAHIGAGVYLPLYCKGTTWQFKGHKNALFVAPLLKGGWETTTSGYEKTDAGKIHSGFFGFTGGGVRFGHFRLGPDNSVAPELISYLDYASGRWDAFDVLGPGGQTQKAWRHTFEGRLKVPGLLPLLVGFDANVGPGPDDMRFVFGTRFDIGRLFALLAPEGLR
ncbi:MAG: hypothetical protein AAB225_16385 [Acidobacteriota bacterium]